jgi:transglutaminase-like putative cysteine protease
VFTLSTARLADDRISTNGDDLFRYRQEVFERVTYDVWPAETGKDLQELSAAERQRYTALPNTGNPRARDLARQWRQEAISDQAIVRQALDRFHQTFVYTLEPPLLGADSVDQFLFGTQRGYCEHFAGAFVFLMRAAGVPARVVMGYQGGQRNLQERYVSVRQYDAHAWAEIWDPPKGWQRIDPTAAVAPERVEQGFASLFPDSPAFETLLGLQTRSRQTLIGLLSIKLDYLDYLVGRWVLGYDPERQQSLLRRLGLGSPQALLMAFSIGFLAMLATFLLFLRLRDSAQRREDPLTTRYRQLCDQYARLGIPRQPSETPLQFAERLMAENARGAATFFARSSSIFRTDSSIWLLISPVSVNEKTPLCESIWSCPEPGRKVLPGSRNRKRSMKRQVPSAVSVTPGTSGVPLSTLAAGVGRTGLCWITWVSSTQSATHS